MTRAMTRIDQIRQDLQQITTLPADRPMTMPGAFYTDPEYFELETRTVLRRGWHCLGRTDEVPEAGDYFTAQLFNEPLIVVRGDDDLFRALDAQLANYQADSFRVVHVEEGIWKTNWKCLVENFMEGYHLSVVHPQTLHGYTPTGLARKAVSGPGFTSYCANYPEGIEARGRGAPTLTEAERNRSTLYAIFPTQVTSQAASLLVSLSIFPISAGEIRVKWTMSARGDDLDQETIQQRISLWTEVNREDREKLERMQVALKSDHAQSGPLAGDDLEGTIRDFQIWLAQMDSPQSQAAE